MILRVYSLDMKIINVWNGPRINLKLLFGRAGLYMLVLSDVCPDLDCDRVGHFPLNCDRVG